MSPLTLNAAAGAAIPITQGQVQGFSLPLPPATGATVTVTLTSVSGQSYLYAVNTQSFEGAPQLDNITGAVIEDNVGFTQGAAYSTAATYGWFDGSTVNIPSFPYAAAADSATNTVSFTYSGAYNTFYTIVVFGAKAGTFQVSATGPTTPLAVASPGSGASSSSTGSVVTATSTSTATQQRPSSSSSSSLPAVTPSSSSSAAVVSTSTAAASVPSSSSSSTASAAGPASTSSSSSSLSSGAIAGIVIGSVVGVVLLCLIAFAVLGCGSRRTKKANGDEDVVRQGTSGYSRSDDQTGQNVEMSHVQTGAEAEGENYSADA